VRSFSTRARAKQIDWVRGKNATHRHRHRHRHACKIPYLCSDVCQANKRHNDGDVFLSAFLHNWRRQPTAAFRKSEAYGLPTLTKHTKMTPVTRAVRFLSSLHANVVSFQSRTATADLLSRTIFHPHYFPKFLLTVVITAGISGYCLMGHVQDQRVRENISPGPWWSSSLLV
jgi:hypothetical protein